MDPVTIIILLISSGALTEILKFVGKIVSDKPIPKSLDPLVGGGVGASLAGMTHNQVFGLPDLGIPWYLGLLLGLLATAALQFYLTHRQPHSDPSVKSKS